MIVDRNIVQPAAAAKNTPLMVGEWALSTQFNAAEDFLPKWADAQKLLYSQGAGWVVCSLSLRNKTSHQHITVLELQARGDEPPRPPMVSASYICWK